MPQVSGKLLLRTADARPQSLLSMACAAQLIRLATPGWAGGTGLEWEGSAAAPRRQMHGV
eukprot:scaffold74896_cov25-Prasinocladus_malaysianus.AAC.1